MNEPLAPRPAELEPAALRRRFKAVCQATDNRFQNFQIRVHRSLSWLDRALEADGDLEPDARLLFGWIAFNALYGAWDEQTGYAARDRESWQNFLRELSSIDADGLLSGRLTELQPQILALLENKFLDPKFWQNPHAPGGFRNQARKALALFYERRWADIAILAVDRVYVLRGQIAHGAATRGSSLNRQSLRQCSGMLEALLPPILSLVIDHRMDDAWPALCYPPVAAEASAAKPRRRLAR